MDPVELTVDEVCAQLSERGRLEWQAATYRAELLKLRARLAELTADQD